MRRWLSIVGIGEDGVEGLSATARGLIAGAEIVFGGARHLALTAPLIRGEARPWPSPFSVEQVLAARGRQVCVLASGDPFLYGVGSTLAEHVSPEETIVVPAPSSFSLAAARLGCGVVLWLWPAWTRLVGLTEASINILLSILGIMVPYFQLIDRLAAREAVIDPSPFGVEKAVGLVLSGAIWAIAFRMHAARESPEIGGYSETTSITQMSAPSSRHVK